MSLARSEGSSQRFYSMSAQVRQERADYYRILERTQQGTLDITPWMEWFLERMMINRLLDGFEGNLTTSKWAALAKTSNDTALRDIQQLVERGVLVRNAAGGRSTSYSLARA
jgi:Fic family protein